MFKLYLDKLNILMVIKKITFYLSIITKKPYELSPSYDLSII